MASERNLPRLLAQSRQESEAEFERLVRRGRWRHLNELVRGQRRTPKRERPICGAKCRNGMPCRAKPVWDRKLDRPRNGRCRLHGGLSSGPKTDEGKAQAREAARRGALISAEKRRGRRRRPSITRVHLVEGADDRRAGVRVVVIPLEPSATCDRG